MALDRKAVFARAEDLGIEFKKNASTKSIAKMIEDLTGEEIEVEKTEPAIKESGIIRCIIHSNDKDNDEIEVYGGLNGKNFQVQIGEEIDFEEKFLPCINDAFVDKQVAILDEDGNPTGKYKNRRFKRYIIERL